MNWQNEDKNMVILFFQMFAHALQSELNKVIMSNFVKF